MSFKWRAYAFSTAFVARYGRRPPTVTPPTVTPNGIGAGDGWTGGSVGGGSVGGVVLVVGGSVVCAVPAPALPDSPKAAANPRRAQVARRPAISMRADAFTPEV
jgi:hypothetical protein